MENLMVGILLSVVAALGFAYIYTQVSLDCLGHDVDGLTENQVRKLAKLVCRRLISIETHPVLDTSGKKVLPGDVVVKYAGGEIAFRPQDWGVCPPGHPNNGKQFSANKRLLAFLIRQDREREMVSALRKHLASPCVKHYQTLKELLSRYDRLRNYDLAGKDVTLPR